MYLCCAWVYAEKITVIWTVGPVLLGNYWKNDFFSLLICFCTSNKYVRPLKKHGM